MGNNETKNLYAGYTDQLNNLDPGQALRYGCYDLSICRKCLFLYGYIVHRFTDRATVESKSEWLYQKCRCMEDDDSKNKKPVQGWNGFDFKKDIDLPLYDTLLYKLTKNKDILFNNMVKYLEEE